MTVFPCGTAVPDASNLNYRAGQTIANAVLARVGAGGQVCVYTSASAGLLVDVNASFPPRPRLTAVDPSRLFDTRTGSGALGCGHRSPGRQVAGVAAFPQAPRPRC